MPKSDGSKSNQSCVVQWAVFVSGILPLKRTFFQPIVHADKREVERALFYSKKVRERHLMRSSFVIKYVMNSIYRRECRNKSSSYVVEV